MGRRSNATRFFLQCSKRGANNSGFREVPGKQKSLEEIMSDTAKLVLLGVAGWLAYQCVQSQQQQSANGAACPTGDYYSPWIVQLSQQATGGDYYYNPLCG
jgi:hypothetical protein